MLLEVFSTITPLTLCLQKSQDKICLADIPNHLETSSLKLNDVRTMKETRKFLTEQNFRELVQIAEEQTSLPTASRLRAEKFDFTEFSDKLFSKFIVNFQAELNEAFAQIQFWKSFSVFDPQNLPRKLSELQTYGIKEMETLINHYGSVQKSSKFGQVHYQGPGILADESMAEFAGFKYLIYTKRKEQEQQFPDQIFNSHRLWLLLSKNDVHKEIYPNCFKLFKLLMIFPLSAACEERLFSKMKIVKNRLHNSLSNATLESLLLIATESPKAGFEDDVLEQFVDELKKRNPSMRLKIYYI